jgi:hypothetical protein
MTARHCHLLAIAYLIAFLGACASTPKDWRDMGETEISAWKALGVNSQQAQLYRKQGLSADAVKAWQMNGFGEQKTILNWVDYGFTADNAGEWLANGFDREQARDWKKERFTAKEAKSWRDSGFSLRDSISNRKKGLKPVD